MAHDGAVVLVEHSEVPCVLVFSGSGGSSSSFLLPSGFVLGSTSSPLSLSLVLLGPQSLRVIKQLSTTVDRLGCLPFQESRTFQTTGQFSDDVVDLDLWDYAINGNRGGECDSSANSDKDGGCGCFWR